MALSIQRRLTLGSLFLYVLMMGSAVLGLYYLTRINAASEAILADNHESMRFMQQLLTTFDQSDTRQEQRLARMDSLIRQQEGNITELGESELTVQLRAHFEQWRTDLPHGANDAKAMVRDIAAIQHLNLNAIDRKSAHSREIGDHALFWLFLLTILITLVGLGFSVAFPSVMSAPIVRLKEAVKAMAARNYRHRIPPFQMKELDELAHAFNDMARELELYDNSNMARLMAEKNRAEAVINSLQDASIGVNEDGVVLFANQQALELLGCAAAQMVGHHVSHLSSRNDLLKHILSERASAPFKVVVGGKENYFTSSSVTINGSSGTLGRLYVIRNITPFQERDLAKTLFLATISHELKTPLASTDIGLTLLERQSATALTSDQGAILMDLRKDHQRLVRIVSELLDLTQAESGNIRVRITELPMDQVVRNALAAVKVSAQQKDIQFAVRTGENAAHVRADAEKAVWVLVNLLSNAVRHSAQSGVVTLETTATDGQVTLRITDQGPGIPQAEQVRLFERFAPGASTHDGTGLGLSIAKEFMSAMGGDIRFDGTTANGTSFILTFAAA
ncbi:MAG: ATP-binding protein [Flavobacteriales bacterium]